VRAQASQTVVLYLVLGFIALLALIWLVRSGSAAVTERQQAEGLQAVQHQLSRQEQERQRQEEEARRHAEEAERRKREFMVGMGPAGRREHIARLSPADRLDLYDALDDEGREIYNRILWELEGEVASQALPAYPPTQRSGSSSGAGMIFVPQQDGSLFPMQFSFVSIEEFVVEDGHPQEMLIRAGFAGYERVYSCTGGVCTVDNPLDRIYSPIPQISFDEETGTVWLREPRPRGGFNEVCLVVLGEGTCTF
jgi:hypothetical protein